MVALYVVSAEEAAGKTAVIAAIGKRLANDGKKVGFLKPLFIEKKAGDDADAVFMKSVLFLSDTAAALCPKISGERDIADKVKKAFDKISEGKDAVLVEGSCEQTAYEIAGALDAKVIMVASYASLASLPQVAATAKGFGKNLLGLILNKVPRSKRGKVEVEAAAVLKDVKVALIGVLPEERVLAALTTGELADAIEGEFANKDDKSKELVENIMLGAMYVDSGIEYFSRKNNKAVILRSDRVDMQAAALETSTTCLVISGKEEPNRYIRNAAERKGIPIIKTGDGVQAIIENIESAFPESRFTQEKKLSKMVELLEQYVDLASLSKGLGF